MKGFRYFNAAVILLFLAALLPAQPVVARPAPQAVETSGVYVPGEVVVTFADGQSARTYRAQATALAGSVGAAVARQYGNIALLSFAPDADIPALVEQVNATGKVLAAQPNYVYATPRTALSGDSAYEPEYVLPVENGEDVRMSWEEAKALRSKVKRDYRIQSVPTLPNDFTDDQWAWNNIQADMIWSNKAASPMVCVIDTGVDDLHPDLSGKVVRGYDFMNMDAVPNDDNGHGTHVAGIIAAKLNNGEKTAMGVSNGKVLAVKAADANGASSSYQIIAAVRYCANNTDVKVINLSIGTWYPDRLLYNALFNAINTKGKLVVAAAGDDARSAMSKETWDRDLPPFYPAGWADPNVGWNNDQSWVQYDPNGNLDLPDNTIYQGLISVAAGRFFFGPHEDGTDFWVWVDTNEDGLYDDGENYNSGYGCATDFTNYGRWVNMVAPGDGIYSTTPVSYPFAGNWFDGWQSGYSWLGGTSPAAAFVSGAAARTWSVNATATNSQIKSLLINNGNELSNLRGANLFAVDEQVTDPTNAYREESGRYGYFDPSEWDYNESEVRAPFCWPTAGDDGDANPNPFGPAEDMSGARALNVAGAMKRFALSIPVRDALNGLPLAGATVQVKNKATGVIADRSVVSSDQARTLLINLPWKEGTTYQFQVTKAGYTYGAQTIWEMTIDTSDPTGTPMPGQGWIDEYGYASIPPMDANLHAVLDWADYENEDLDLYLWLPKGPVIGATLGAVIGRGPFAWNYQKAYDIYPDSDWNGFLGMGTLLGPAETDFPEGYTIPYAQHNFDRGSDQRSPTESITIRTKLGKPWYKGDYTFLVSDFSSNYGGEVFEWGNAMDVDDGAFKFPIVRLWSNGKLLKSSPLDLTATDPDCYDEGGVNADLWKALTINGLTYTTSMECGTAEWPRQPHTIIPYP